MFSQACPGLRSPLALTLRMREMRERGSAPGEELGAGEKRSCSGHWNRSRGLLREKGVSVARSKLMLDIGGRAESRPTLTRRRVGATHKRSLAARRAAAQMGKREAEREGEEVRFAG